MAVLAARKLAMLVGVLCIVPIVLVPQIEGLWPATLLVALVVSAHQAWAANVFTLPSDTMSHSAVRSIVGFCGTVGALGGMGAAQLAGYVLQTTGSYAILFAMVPGSYFLALLLLQFLLPRRKRRKIGATGQPSPSAARCRRAPISGSTTTSCAEVSSRTS